MLEKKLTSMTRTTKCDGVRAATTATQTSQRVLQESKIFSVKKRAAFVKCLSSVECLTPVSNLIVMFLKSMTRITHYKM